jgi:aminopeptidase-like protein
MRQKMADPTAGQRAHDLAKRLWPINRSLTGAGVVETLEILAETLPGLTLHQVPSGTQAFDWTVPKEWHVTQAYLEGPDGRRICDFADNNLHLVGYSQPVDAVMSLDDLQPHLHSLPDQPDAIPYVTSYYGPNWGFCLTDTVRRNLLDGDYRVVIEAKHFDGNLTYADLLIQGDSDEEILFSTYICHPSMANNELSGPIVAEALAQEIMSRETTHYSYRFVFVPETLGALTYLSTHVDRMKSKIKAGFVLTCVGDERTWSYMPSRHGKTLADRAVLQACSELDITPDPYTFLQRGSDERQYCAPGIDLPVCSLMRSKYGTYPEYHTSLDDLTLVTPTGLEHTITAYGRVIDILEANVFVKTQMLGEPQLGKRGLYSNLSKAGSAAGAMTMRNLIAYADGTQDLIGLAAFLDCDVGELSVLTELLKSHDVLATKRQQID